MKFSPDENRLIALKAMADETDDKDIRKTCLSLILWFQRHGAWTDKQRRLVDAYTK